MTFLFIKRKKNSLGIHSSIQIRYLNVVIRYIILGNRILMILPHLDFLKRRKECKKHVHAGNGLFLECVSEP